MRLHSLTLTAFGPFPGTEHIDFDALSQDGLFLLHGRTGSGKSFVLDAITFALYGQVPGERGRSSPRLRSDHAPAGRSPEVTVVFTRSDRTYRITRRPQHTVAKQRGQGTTQRNQTAQLEVWNQGRWEAAANGTQAVGKELQETLPLDRHQFTKVILLPQGDFAEFLRSSSKDKQDLLEKLFDTEELTLLEDRLREQAKAAREQVVDADRSIELHTSGVREAAGRLLGTEWEAPDRDEHIGQPGQAGLFEDAVAGAVQRRTALVSEIEALTARRSQAARSAEQARHRRTVLLRHAEHTAKEEEHRQRSRPAEAARTAVDQHRRADQLLSWFDTAARAHRRTQHRQDLGAQAVRQAEESLNAQQDIEPRLLHPGGTEDEHDSSAIDATLRELDDALRELTELQGRLAAEDAGTLELDHQRLTVHQGELNVEQDRLRAQEATTAEQTAQLKASLRDLEARDQDADELDSARDGARIRRDELRARLEVLTALQQVEQQRGAVEADLEERRQEAGSAADEHQQLLSRHLQSLAHRLAGDLIDGEPCLVCGSLQHPAPAPQDPEAVTEETVEEALRRSKETAASLAAAETKLTGLRTRADELREQAGDHAADGVAVTQDALQQAGEALAEWDRRREDQQAVAARLIRQRAELHDAETALTATRHQLELRAAEHSSTADGAQRIEKMLSGLRGAHASVTDRTAALECLETKLTAAREALRQVSTAAEQGQQADLEAAEKLAASRFDTRSQLDVALLDDEELKQCADLVEAWETMATELRMEAEHQDIREGSRLHEAGHPVPGEDEVRAAEERAAEAAEQHDEVRRSLQQFDDRFESFDSLLGRLNRALDDREERLADQIRLGELAETVNGAGPDNPRRMTLTTFVLAARLERVAQAATRHLQVMSEGRYRLLHDDDPSGRGRQGLELQVHDEHSDDERPTSSLSGGETFMAALAMALGLAEVVQSDAGGIGLESLFIDEGFGSLDEQTLEHVMTALSRLQGEGRRVGVVSHVTEMHGAIPVQLRITRGTAGSTTQMVLP